MIIRYIARRELQSGISDGDEIILDVPVSEFYPDLDYSESTSTGVGGYRQTSEKYYRKTWNIKTSHDDTNTQADYEQFLYSVLGGKRFAITDYDHNDIEANVKMDGKWTQDSDRRFNKGEFNYAFTARAV
tara:strand:- start:138 stop:527 length:390 start_codon:yes stop_codon:yes gene_type:complete